jgi:PilZ domain
MPRERRKTFRVEWNSPATIYDLAERFPRPCVVSNFSTGGARIAGVRPETIADEFLLRLAPRCRVRKCRVIWRSHEALGVQFCDAMVPAPTAEAPQRKREPAGA